MSETQANGTDVLDGIAAIQKRDVATLVEAQFDMIGGMADLLASYQKEMLQAVFDTSAAATSWAVPPKDAGIGIGLMFDAVIQAARDSTARSNALTQTATLSSGKIGGLLSERWYAAMGEWKAAMMAAAGPEAAP